MTEALRASYEAIPYESKPITQSHPDRLATMATLHGLTPPPVPTCRVLELGCAGGGNLIPMALTLPQGRFVGIDLAPGQIASGEAVVRALGLTNLDLRALSIMDVGPDFGEFDYILAHGVYSWVPPEVQDKILAIFARHLAPNGLAYVSYNTYPGWHLRAMVREMLLFHTGRFAEAGRRIAEARAFLAFLKQALGDSKTAYGEMIRDEVDLLLPQSDSYLFHEQLESTNEPLYFHEFAARLAAHGLQYVSETRFGWLEADLPSALDDVMNQLTDDPMRREQYLDFLRARTFRRSVVCRAGLSVDRSLPPETVKGLRSLSYARPASDRPDVRSDAVEEFRSPEDARISTNNPLVKAALLCLAEAAPRALSFEELRQAVGRRLELDDGAPDPGTVAEMLRHGFVKNVLELHIHQPALAATATERPVASPLARLQVVNQSARVTNLWHRLVELEPIDRMVLAHCDGDHDRAGLLAALEELARQDVLVIHHEGQPVRDPERVRQAVQPALEPSLRKLAGLGLFLA
jgi:methyltransferase-like protein/SAM-dependent methyltransferase